MNWPPRSSSAARSSGVRLAASTGGGVASTPAFFTFEEISLSVFIFACDLRRARGLDLRLRLGLVSRRCHPVWVAALTWIFAKSTWVNGVLHRNEWRGGCGTRGRLKT